MVALTKLKYISEFYNKLFQSNVDFLVYIIFDWHYFWFRVRIIKIKYTNWMQKMQNNKNNNSNKYSNSNIVMNLYLFIHFYFIYIWVKKNHTQKIIILKDWQPFGRYLCFNGHYYSTQNFKPRKPQYYYVDWTKRPSSTSRTMNVPLLFAWIGR